MRRDLRRHVSNGGIFSTALRLRDMYEGSVAIVPDQLLTLWGDHFRVLSVRSSIEGCTGT